MQVKKRNHLSDNMLKFHSYAQFAWNLFNPCPFYIIERNKMIAKPEPFYSAAVSLQSAAISENKMHSIKG